MDEHTSQAEWQELATTSDEVQRAAQPIDEGDQGEANAQARENLLAVTASARKLAKSLDGLSRRYESRSVAEPSDAHVALDQAAAAAEDLAACTRAAAQAIEEQT